MRTPWCGIVGFLCASVFYEPTLSLFCAFSALLMSWRSSIGNMLYLSALMKVLMSHFLISEIRKWDIKTFMSAERYSMLPIELRQLMSNALNAQNSESVGS